MFRFPEDERLELYGLMFDLLNIEHLTNFPEAVKDTKVLGADGSKIEIRGAAPIRDSESGLVINDGTFTVPDAG